MEVVTLCGSMRFAAEMQKIAMELETKHGYCVLQPIFDTDIALSGQDLENLAEAHLKKIEISDIVYIVNIGGYIGESVSKELQYAKKLNKKILFHEA